MSENRRSAIPQARPSRRAPSPSHAAFASRGSVTGPLGGYRPASREGIERSTSQGTDAIVAGSSMTSRFGFGTPSTSATALASKSVNAKRTSSIAGLKDPETPGPNGNANKRPLITSAAIASPRFPTASPSYDASKLKSEYERRELLSKQAYEKLQSEYKASGRETEKYKQEKLALLRQWEDSNAERKEEKENLEEQRRFLNERVNSLTQQNQELKLKVEEAQAERARLTQTQHGEETKQSMRITSLEFELASAKASAEENKEMREKMELALKRREEEWEEERLRLASNLAANNDSKKATVELSDLLSKVHKMETESLTLQRDNRLLKTRVESIEALKEQNRVLSEKYEIVNEIRRKLAEAESRVQDLEAEREDWNRKLTSGVDTVAFESMQSIYSNVDEGIPTMPAPQTLNVDTLPGYMSNLQGAIAGLTVRSRILGDRLESSRKHQIEDEQKLVENSRKLVSISNELNMEKSERLKATKRAEAARAEVESYVKLLDTFQEESRNQSAQFNAASAEHIQVLETRIKTADENLNEVRSEVERLTQLTQEGGGMLKEEREQIYKAHEEREATLQRALDEVRKEHDELEVKCIELGKINDDLYLRVGRGEFNQGKLRCLELKNNPVNQDRIIRLTTLEALRQENKKLLEQMEEFSKKVTLQGGDRESVEDGMTAMVPIQTLDNQKREYERLEETMRNRDKAFDRLKQAFGAKATEYVAAVKALFGYDMHVVSKGKVKLRSIYARTAKGTSLTFDSGDEGNVGAMKLVGEARQGVAVGTLQEYWLGNDRFSVPCFLAALQLELYEGTTRAVRGTWEAEDG